MTLTCNVFSGTLNPTQSIQDGYFGEMVFTVGRLVWIKYFVGSEVICETGFNNTFHYLGYERKIRDWTIVRELIFD